MAAAAWSGAFELAGFSLNVRLWKRTKSVRHESFRTLAPDGEPVNQVFIHPDTEEVVARDKTKKGVKVGKDTFVPLTPEAESTITESTKTALATPAYFAPMSTVDLSLALGSFVVTPDDNVPGSEKPVNIMWNGLRKSGLAYMTVLSMRGGSPDVQLALYADDEGLWAVSLPFAPEVKPVPAHDFEPDDKQADLFGRFVEGEYEVKDFDLAAQESEYAARREQTIQAVLDGKELDSPPVRTTADTPDLMAKLEETIEQNKRQSKSKPKPKKKAAKGKKKVAA